MKGNLFAAILMLLVSAFLAFGQKTVVVTDPTIEQIEAKLSDDEMALVGRVAVPAFAAKYQSDACTVSLDPSGIVSGSFTRSGAKQRLAFFQVCQTGNGLGVVGLVLIENGKVAGIYGADSGWSWAIERLPDINSDGIDEFTLAYGGGMHQGQGGVGVDIMQFSGKAPKGIGWFKAEEFMDTEAVNVWRVTAKTGKTPTFYKQKFRSDGSEKWRRSGANTPFKLGKAYGKFEEIK